MADSKRGAAMIVVHHVNNSRSQRILWLLKELGLPYEIKLYNRHARDQRRGRGIEGGPPGAATICSALSCPALTFS
jgi:hypothetical protein